MNRCSLVGAALALAIPSCVWAAEAYPARPIRFIVNTAPGGSTDLVTRLIAQRMGETLGQSIVVDNRAGADGLVGIRAALGARPDGYTVLSATGTLLVQPMVKKDAGYEPLKHFKGVGLMARSPFLLVIGADQPDKSFTDFAARAKATPGKLSYASAGVGTLSHLPAALMAQEAGLQLQHVPYKGNGPAFADVAAGRVNTIMTAYTSALPFLQSGRMRPIAVTPSRRLPVLPNVPTLAEQGIPGYSFYTWYALLAPAGTPNDVIQRLSDALRAAQANTEVVERFRADSSEVTPMSAEEFNGFLRQETAKLDKLVTSLGLTKE